MEWWRWADSFRVTVCLTSFILFLLMGCTQTFPTGKPPLLSKVPPSGKLSLSFQDHEEELRGITRLKTLEKKTGSPPKVNVEVIVGASGSMLTKDEKGKIKFQEAKRETLRAIQEINKRFQNPIFGLRIYGSRFSQKAKNCQDTELLVPIGKADMATLREKVRSLKTRGGMAPVAFSIMKAKEDLEKLEGRKIILLVTDGKETCSGNLCQVISQVMASGIEKPLIRIVGPLPDDKIRKQLECVANLTAKGSLRRIQKEEPKKIAFRPPFTSYIYTLYNAKNEVVARQSIRAGTLILHNLSPGRYRLQIETSPENLPGFPISTEVIIKENQTISLKIKGAQISSY
jgi:hypothetical protein